MSKRKRDEDDKHSQEGKLRIRQRQLEGAIDLGKKNVFRALKIGRGFERQKLGRRQKAAKGKQAEGDITRLIVEVAVLKSLDLVAIAELHVYKTLVKTKSVAGSSIFPHYILSYVEASNAPRDTAYANVTARLYSTNPVRVAMDEFMTTVRGILRLEENEPVRKKRLRATDFKRTADIKENSLVQSDSISIESDQLSPPAPTENKFNELLGLSGNSTETTAETGDRELINYDPKISNLSSNSSQSLSDDEGIDIRISRARPSSYSPFSDEASSPKIPSLPIETSTYKERIKDPTPSATDLVKSTTFLPSLMMGGFYSGSESGSNDDEDVAEVNRRKNRMGQQARRQLWEKKFGNKANHLKRQSRDQSWDARKGAQGGDGRRQKDRGRRGDLTNSSPRRSRDEGGQYVSGANNEPVQARILAKAPKTVNGPLHPSWEAAKKAKAQKSSIAFSGKKKVFD